MNAYSNKHLHIVSMDIPYPADYGGVIDVFYKIKALASIGIKIHLHCYEYGRAHQQELETYCTSVHYYPRKTGWKGLSFQWPYMMYSRRSKTLLKNLQDIEAPILLEGVHCSYYLHHSSLKNRRQLLRNQNIEADYFYQLQFRSTSFIQKWYYKIEAILLRKTERRLQPAYAFLTVAQTDYLHFQQLYPNHIHAYIPSFTEVKSLDNLPLGIGKHLLYQGNLGHPENVEAALYILNNVVPRCPEYTFIFAGKDPNKALYSAAKPYSNVLIHANPSAVVMQQLLVEAQIHLLLTFQATGLKLKLLAAYQNGRHIIANSAMLLGSNLESVCHQADTVADIVLTIQQLMSQPFTTDDIVLRKEVHTKLYDPLVNAQKIATIAFD